MAFRLWDRELASLVRRCKGRLRKLHVAGSGITGKSLIFILTTKALAPRVDEISLENCCNLKLCDVLAFAQALAPDASCALSRPRSNASGSQTGPQKSPPLSRHAASSGSSVGTIEALELLTLGALCPPPPPPSHIAALRVSGCKQLGAWEAQQLRQLVVRLDVAACACGRVGVLKRCTDRPVAPAGTPGRAPTAASPAGWGHPRPAGSPAGGAAGGIGVPGPQRECPGLCSACVEVFKGCGEGACGACLEPRAAEQGMRARVRLWLARRETTADVRRQWRDFRGGLEMTA